MQDGPPMRALIETHGARSDGAAPITEASGPALAEAGRAPRTPAAVRPITGLSSPQAAARLVRAEAGTAVVESCRAAFARLRPDAALDGAARRSSRGTLDRPDAAGARLRIAAGEARLGPDRALTERGVAERRVATPSADDERSTPRRGVEAGPAAPAGDAGLDGASACSAGGRGVGRAGDDRRSGVPRLAGAKTAPAGSDAVRAAFGAIRAAA